MKSLIFAAQSLCKGSSSPHYLFLGPRFLLHKHRQTSHVSLPPSFSTIRFRDPPLLPNPMAACTDSTRPETSTFPHGPNQSRTTADEHRCISKFANLGRPRVLNHVSSVPICRNRGETINTPTSDERRDRDDDDDVWLKMQEEAQSDVSREPILSNYYHNAIFCHRSLERALANHLSIKLSDSSLPSGTLSELFYGLLDQDGDIVSGVKDDLRAVYERDPACISYVHCFLNYKGFLACQAHRVAHKLWTQDRKILALLIQNRVSEVFAVDIHPGAKIGSGILVDHATGLVVGETAVIGNDVSILHNVTLGGTGKDSGDRHPKIGDGVLIGAGTCILGNIRIGEGAKIGAGSVVLSDIPPRTTAVGNPARLVGGKKNPIKLDKMPSLTMDHTSHVSEWSDYVI